MNPHKTILHKSAECLNKGIIPLLVVLIVFILNIPAFKTYFYQDDFIHMSFSKDENQVISSFNLFHKGDYPFFRPLSTQTYFYFGKILFGLYPLGYHVINFLIFYINVFLVFFLMKKLSSLNIASLSTIFYGLNSTHIAPLFSAANVQELLLSFFGLLTVITFISWIKSGRKKTLFLSVIFYISALMSKETALVIPGILSLYLIFYQPLKIINIIKRIMPFVVILGVYLVGHFFYYGIAQGPSYIASFGKQTLNIFIWYLLWAMSVPNILVDFIGPGFKISRIFFEVGKMNAYIFTIIFPMFVLSVLSLIIGLSIKFRSFKIYKNILFGIAWFITGIIPLLPFPKHRLATEQAFSLIGLSLVLAYIINMGFMKKGIYRYLAYAAIFSYMITAINSSILAQRTHWVIRSATIAENTINYLKTNKSEWINGSGLYFYNGEVKIPQWGSSRQIFLALGNGEGTKLIFDKLFIIQYFEDINPIPKSMENSPKIFSIDSSKLLGY